MIGAYRTIDHSKSIIRFHDPYARLNLRAKFDMVAQKNLRFQQISPLLDVFSILDAVVKRGGIDKISSRMQEVLLSLPYYEISQIKNSLELIACIVKQPEFSGVIAEMKSSNEAFVQQHLLPPTSGQGYYQLTNQQSIFVRQNFSNVDQYLTIKTLAYFGAAMNKLNSVYRDKYYKLRKWLFIHDVITNIPEQELAIINKLSQLKGIGNKVCIYGITLANIIMGIKLSKLGYYVKVVDMNYGNMHKWNSGIIPDIIKQGIYLNNELEAKRFNQILSYYAGGVSQAIDYNPCTSSDNTQDNTKSQKVQQIKDPLFRYESVFIMLLQQIISECPSNANKPFWHQLYNRIINANNGYESRSKHRSVGDKIDIDGVRVYFERFVMLNKIKDELQATVGDIRRFIEEQYMVNQPLTPYNNKQIYRNSKIKMAIKNIPYFIRYQKMRAKKYQSAINKNSPYSNINVCTDSIVKKIQFRDNLWFVTSASFFDNKIYNEQFTHLIYSESQSIEKSIKQHCFLPELVNPINFPILHQLTPHSQIHCLYRFTQSIQFRETNGHKYSYNYFGSEIGIIHFYILSSKNELLACVRKSTKYHAVDYFKEILNILNSVLRIIPKLEPPKQPVNQYMETSRYFSIKDESLLDSTIKLREKENMYLSIPIICIYGDLSKNIIQNQTKINNKIIVYICNKNANQHLMHRRMENLYHSSRPINKNINMLLPPEPIPISYSSIPYMEHPAYVTSVGYSLPPVMGSMANGMVPRQIHMDGNNRPYQHFEQPKPNDNDKIVTQVDQTSTNHLDNGANNKVTLEQDKQDKQKQQAELHSETVNNNSQHQEFFQPHHPVIAPIKQALCLCVQQITNCMDNIKKKYAGQGFNQVKLTPNFMPFFLLNSAVAISQQQYLLNIGFPLLSPVVKPVQHFFHNLTVLHESLSLIHPNQQSLFYNTCIMYEKMPLYCVIQLLSDAREGNLDFLILFHTDLSLLNKSISQIHKQGAGRQQMGMEQERKLKECRIERVKYILPSLIEGMVGVEIQKKNSKQNSKSWTPQEYSTILTEILATKVERLCRQNEGIQDMSEDKYSICGKMVSDAGTVTNSIYEEANRSVAYLCTLYKLRSYSLADMLMGKISMVYIKGELSGMFNCGQPETWEEDLQEWQQSERTAKVQIMSWLQQQTAKNKLNKYPLAIQDRNCPQLSIKRRFVTIENSGYLGWHFIEFNIPKQELTFHPTLPKQNGVEVCFKQEIRRLLERNYPIWAIVQNINHLIREEIQQMLQAIGLLSSSLESHRYFLSYLVMTRMDFLRQDSQIHEKSMKKLTTLRQQLQSKSDKPQEDNDKSLYSTTAGELDKMEQMIDQGDLIFEGSQFMASFPSLC